MIRRADFSHLDTLTKLALRLWPENEEAELKAELEDILSKPDGAFFLAENEGEALGFAQCQLRYDYVGGTESSPVGYLEGIFVDEACRRQGIARALLAACQDWARNQGCQEFASDCELSNMESLGFHLRLGFIEVNRIICFTKKL